MKTYKKAKVIPGGSEFKHKYLYCASHNNEWFKFGITSGCPERRVRGMKTSNPLEPKLVWAIRHYKAEFIEKAIHLFLKRHNVSGEWFDVTEYYCNMIFDQLEGHKFIDWVRNQIYWTALNEPKEYEDYFEGYDKLFDLINVDAHRLEYITNVWRPKRFDKQKEAV